MMILKKKEVIAASLVVLIGLAGYLNWSYQDTVSVRDNDSYLQTGKMLGEAEMVSSTNEGTEKEEPDTAVVNFDEAKTKREEARAAAMEILKSTSQDESADEASRALAGEKLVKCAENIELENTIESVANAKGYPQICAYINEGAAVLTVKSDGLSGDDTAKICEIVTDTAGIGMDKIKIVEVK